MIDEDEVKRKFKEAVRSFVLKKKYSSNDEHGVGYWKGFSEALAEVLHVSWHKAVLEAYREVEK